jgi:threonine dehydratase
MLLELTDLETSQRESKAPLGVVRPVTIVEAQRLSKRLDIELTLASEAFQHTGSFKFRAAYNVASNIPHQHIIAASSGNFGQALAYACQLLGKSCIVVMPLTSARIKVDAVREYEGAVDLVDVNIKSRAERVAELRSDHPEAYIASAYDDPLIIEGNASLGEELCALDRQFDFVVVPIGGGGLSSGIITGIRRAGKDIEVIGAEPLLANDAAQSLRCGHIVRHDTESQTIADGARTVSLGKHNWEILRTGLSGIIEVPEQKIKEGVRLLYSLANLKAEPTGALAMGALLTEPKKFRGKRVCCVVSGGNVDAHVFREILAS